MPPPLLHIGYHRTGSTWLQRHVFGAEAGGFVAPFDRRGRVREALIAPHPFDFDAAAARAAFADGLAAAEAAGRVAAISAERLSGYPDSGGHDSKEIAERLAAVFPDARVLIFIREQRAILRSFYKVYVRAGGNLPLERYVAPRGGEMRRPNFRFEHFAYHRLIAHYHALFGRERVLVEVFERMIAAPADSVARIAAFAGTEAPPVPDTGGINRSLSALTVAFKRPLNPFIACDSTNGYSRLAPPGITRPATALFDRLDRVWPAAWRRAAEDRLAARVARLAADRYRASNRHTGALIETDLEPFGYDL